MGYVGLTSLPNDIEETLYTAGFWAQANFHVLAAGSAPCLSLLATLIDYKFWFDAAQSLPEVYDIQFYAILGQTIGTLSYLVPEAYQCITASALWDTSASVVSDFLIGNPTFSYNVFPDAFYIIPLLVSIGMVTLAAVMAQGVEEQGIILL